VFVASDPVGTGYVATLARPGGKSHRPTKILSHARRRGTQASTEKRHRRAAEQRLSLGIASFCGLSQ
jgi:hypothetical protein